MVSTCFAVAVALVIAMTRELPTFWITASLALLGLGLGPAASTSLVAPQSSVAWPYRGAVTSAVYATRMLGGSLAVVALGAAGAWTADPAVARFTGVALLALAGVVGAVLLAPGRARATA